MHSTSAYDNRDDDIDDANLNYEEEHGQHQAPATLPKPKVDSQLTVSEFLVTLERQDVGRFLQVL